MIKAHRITADSIERLRAIYERFCGRAKADYGWLDEPVEFEMVCLSVQNRLFFGYWLEDTALPEPIGFMLYRLEAHHAIEINLIYSESDDRKTVLDRFIRLFIADIRDLEGWDVVSYAMLGRQDEFIRTISWYGFKPVGQAILKFDLLDPIALQIMKQQALESPGPEYTIASWRPEYADETAKNIYEAFHTATDAHWDPRFRSVSGAKDVLDLFCADVMGKLLPECTTIALKDGVPVGFCFLLQSGPVSGNVPLVGICPAEKGKGLGNIMLQRTLDTCLQEVVSGKLNVFSINTTMDTDNIAAIKMYRRMGFREETHYPHVYLTREKAQAFRPGQWC
jgi:RimJ/RimL family protein N-acetyltransferase